MLYAYDAIRRSGYTPTAPLFFQSVVEEEMHRQTERSHVCSGVYKADCVLIPEPMKPKAFASASGFWSGFGCTCLVIRSHASGFQEVGSNAIENAFGHLAASQGARKEMERSESRANHSMRDTPIQSASILARFRVVSGLRTYLLPARLRFASGVYPGWNLEDARAEIEECVS